MHRTPLSYYFSLLTTDDVPPSADLDSCTCTGMDIGRDRCTHAVFTFLTITAVIHAVLWENKVNRVSSSQLSGYLSATVSSEMSRLYQWVPFYKRQGWSQSDRRQTLQEGQSAWNTSAGRTSLSLTHKDSHQSFWRTHSDNRESSCVTPTIF